MGEKTAERKMICSSGFWKFGVCMLFALIPFVLVLSACTPETVPYKEELVNVGFECINGEDKTVIAEIDTTTAYYTYTAEALFTLSDGSYVYGDTEGVEKRIGEYGTEMIGPFTQGKWRFHVYAYNKDDGLIRDGETDVYLRKVDTDTPLYNKVPITIYRTALRTGNVHFSLTTTQVSSDKPYIVVTPIREGVEKASRTFYANEITADAATFDFTLTGLQSGAWEFKLETYDNKVKEGGAAVSTYILGNDTTEISGEIYPTEWIYAGFDITMPTQVEGTIGTSITTRPGTASFKWYATSGTPAVYKWYIDGVLKSEESTGAFSYDFQNPGVYTVTCVAVDDSGKEMGHSTCNVTVLATESAKAKWTWTNPKAEGNTGSLSGTVTKRPTVRFSVEETNGVIVYSGYPTITGSEGNWTATAVYEQDGEEITTTITLTGTTATVVHSKDVRGYVTLEVGL